MIDEPAARHEAGVTGTLDPKAAEALGEMVAAVVVDRSGVVSYASGRWCALTGTTPGEIVGTPWHHLVGDGPPGAGSSARRSLSAVRPVAGEVAVAGGDGRSIAVGIEVASLREGRKVAGWMVVAEPAGGPEPSEAPGLADQSDPADPADDADEADLGWTAGGLRSLMAHLPIGVVVTDGDGVAFANRAANQLLGPSAMPEESEGAGRWHRRDLARAHRDPDAAETRMEEIVRTAEVVIDERVELVNGRSVGRSFVPVVDEGVRRGHLWLFRDLSEELAVAAEREYLLAMEQEQSTRLTELDSLKSDLVASVSHELRTPLTSIVSFTHLLRDGLGTDSRADQEEFLDIIGRNTDRLLRLVDELLLLDRLESNSLLLSYEPVSLPALVEVATSSIRPAADEKGVVLEVAVTDGPPLHGDVDRLGQLLDNLLVNAVKFTPPGGRVRTEVAPVGAGWRLEVADTGIGIPDDELGELFHRFYRASNARKESVPGSGLGLTIAQRIAEVHHGSITVRSQEGAGTTFTVELAGAAAPERAPSPLAGSRP